ncbi:hypothetical protein V5799_023334 [Amblyomma americanum]|uniref:Uncharacterized protein n=1 Tax=Amblyomma americanum TaxID=6943 RepID=A0AAQ4FIL0_AMBAM
MNPAKVPEPSYIFHASTVLAAITWNRESVVSSWFCCLPYKQCHSHDWSRPWPFLHLEKLGKLGFLQSVLLSCPAG